LFKQITIFEQTVKTLFFDVISGASWNWPLKSI